MEAKAIKLGLWNKHLASTGIGMSMSGICTMKVNGKGRLPFTCNNCFRVTSRSRKILIHRPSEYLSTLKRVNDESVISQISLKWTNNLAMV